jgi:hypothetical protein
MINKSYLYELCTKRSGSIIFYVAIELVNCSPLLFSNQNMKDVNSEYYILNIHNNMSFRAQEESHPRHKESRQTENVLVLQGGGSLGAFACGVFKDLVKKNIRIDIAAGTSIGAVNAAIIVGSKSYHPEKDLEEFWLEIAESNPMIIYILLQGNT